MTNILNCLIYSTLFTLPFYNVWRIRIMGASFTHLDILIGLTITIWLLDRTISKDNKLTLVLPKMVILMGGLLVAFLIVGGISVLVSPVFLHALSDFRAFFLEPALFASILFFELHRQSRSPDEKVSLSFDSISLTLIGSAVMVSLYGLLQYVTGFNPIAPLEAAQGRITSFFNNPNFLALYCGPVFVFGLMMFDRLKVIFRTSVHKTVFISGLVLIGSSLLLSKSAGAILGLGAVIVFISLGFVYRYHIANKSLVVTLLTFIGIVYLISFLYLAAAISSYTPDYRNVYPRPDPSTWTIRLCLWEGTKNLLHDNFWLGTGLSGFKNEYPHYQTCDTEHLPYPHNFLLNFWVETGLVGMVLIGCVTGLLIITLFWVGRLVALGLASVFIYWFAHGQVDVPFFKNDLSVLFWVFVALSLFILSEKRRGGSASSE